MLYYQFFQIVWLIVLKPLPLPSNHLHSSSSCSLQFKIEQLDPHFDGRSISVFFFLSERNRIKTWWRSKLFKMLHCILSFSYVHYFIIRSFSEHLGVPNVLNFNRLLCFNLISWPNTMVGENLLHLFIEGNMPTVRNE